MAASLQLAITAIRSGRKEEGRQLLNLLIQQNPNDEQAWLWMSSVVNTDEQRARCLYHVLAINPDNDIARRGLKLLGIVVTDSRPVKVPRDSQPIRIPKPTPTSQAGFPSADQLDSKPVPAQERRPFRVDPQAIVAELPFTPVKEPFSDSTSAEPEAEPAEAGSSGSEPVQPAPTEGAPRSAEKVDPVERPSEPVAPVPAHTESNRPPSEPVPVDQPSPGTQGVTPPVQAQHPSEPVPVAQNEANGGGTVSQPEGASQTAGFQNPAAPPQGQPAAQPPFAGTQNDTRPSQPVPVHSNITQGMQPPQQQGYQNQYPTGPGMHSNATMGMPTQYLPTQNPSQPGPAFHSNPTSGMPMPAQGWGPGNSQSAQPSPIHSSGTIQMPTYWQPQFQPAMAQNPAVHSNSTMPMPAGYDPFPAMGPAPQKDYRIANASKSGSKRKKSKDEAEEDEVNILAVIIFGSLSVTALGGLGMLILLMFTTA